MDDDIHVVPTGDLKQHELCRTCWCDPVQCDDAPWVWLHNALDGREAYETGERKLN